MNNSVPQTKYPTAPRRRLRQGGNTMVEVALALPALVYMLLGIASFAGIFNTSIELNNAARAGAQSPPKSQKPAADTSGISVAAKQDAPNIPSITVTSSRCTCNSGSS